MAQGTRILGIDWGERKLGIALSDETRCVASPHAVERCRTDKERITAILRHVQEQNVGVVVMGIPLSLSGEEGPTGRAVRRFSEMLEKRLQVPLELWDERLTTGSAQRALIEAGIRRSRRKELVDKVAASVMLQSFLDCQQARRDDPE